MPSPPKCVGRCVSWCSVMVSGVSRIVATVLWSSLSHREAMVSEVISGGAESVHWYVVVKVPE